MMPKLISHLKQLSDTDYVDLLSIEHFSIFCVNQNLYTVKLFLKSRAAITLNKTFLSLEDTHKFISKEILNAN